MKKKEKLGEKRGMIIMFTVAALVVVGVVILVGKFESGELTPKKEDATTMTLETQVETISPEDFVNMSEFRVEKKDHSVKDKASGEVVADAFYEQVTLLYGKTELTDSINKIIARDYNNFLSDMAEHKVEKKAVNGDYFNYTAEVTNNTGGIFSIKVTKDININGVNTTDYYGMTFDLNTGKELTLVDITSQSDWGLKSDLKPLVWDTIKDNKHTYPDAENILNSLEFYEYLYYVKDGKIVVTLPTYTVGDAGLGAVVVETDKSAY